MVIASFAPVAGDYQDDAKIRVLNASTAAIAKGDVVFIDPADNDAKTAPTAAKSPSGFGVCVEAKPVTGAVDRARVAVAGTINVVADGTITPGRMVKVSGSTAGRVIEYVRTTMAGATNADVLLVADERQVVVGKYVGKLETNANEYEGGPAGTRVGNATVGQVIAVELLGLR